MLQVCNKLILCFALVALPLHSASAIEKPTTIDSRIKTYIYNENEVFKVTVNYGYQTSIEFGDSEEIQTISVGNNYLWQLTPIGKRLFIKPLEDDIITNMTILTNKRSYQFELQSKSLENNFDEELAYVIKFFYPHDDNTNLYNANDDVNTKQQPPSYKQYIEPFNFNYTQEGSPSIAPLKIFDDGKVTFFKFKKGMSIYPAIYDISNGGRVLLEPRQKGEYILVNTVASKFEMILADKKVTVFNEAR